MARELGYPEAESLYAKVADYAVDRPVPSALLKEGLAAIFDPAADMLPGDVLLLKMSKLGPAGHIAIVTSPDTAVHAQIGSKDWVKETKLRALLSICPLVSVWRWRDGC